MDGHEQDAERADGQADEHELEQVVADGAEALETFASTRGEGKEPADDDKRGGQRDLREADDEQHPGRRLDRRKRRASERERGEQRAEQDAPEAHRRSALRAVRPEHPAVVGHVDDGVDVRTFHGQPHLAADRALAEWFVDFPRKGNGLLAGSHGDDELRAVLAHGDGFAAVGERGDLRGGGQLDEEVLAEAAPQGEVELRGALARAERDGVRAAADGDGRASDGLGPAEREVHAFAGPRLPDGNQIAATGADTGVGGHGLLRCGFEDGREAGHREIPNGRRDEMPALDPGIVRACGELQRGRDGEPALPRELLLLRAEPDFDEAVLHHGVRGKHVFAGQ